MTAPFDPCRLLVNDDGQVVASYQGSDLSPEARTAMLHLVEAARRQHQAEWTPERQARYYAGQQRIRERMARIREQRRRRLAAMRREYRRRRRYW